MLKESDLRDLADRVSTTPRSFRRDRSGARSVDQLWETTRTRVVSALVAEPDLVWFFTFLVSNQLCTQAERVLQILCEMVVLLEGSGLPSSTPPAPARVSEAVQAAVGKEEGEIVASDIRRITQQVNAYVRKELIPRTTRSRRLQRRGDDARAQYAAEKERLDQEWTTLYKLIAATTSRLRWTPETLLPVVASRALASVEKTVPLHEEQVTDFMLQLAAASSALEAAGREVDPRARCVSAPEPFPAELELEAAATTLTTVPAPELLGIRAGDLVQVRGTAAATITAVGDSSCTLSAALPDGPIKVLPAAFVAWEAMIAAVEAAEVQLPVATSGLTALSLREQSAAAYLRDTAAELLRLASLLGEPTAEALQSYARLSGSVEPPLYTGTTISAAARAYAPVFPARVRTTGRIILDELDANGFDYVAEVLYRRDIDELATMGLMGTSKFARVASTADILTRYSEGVQDGY